ncbi:MAG: hypothetical protein U0931_04985 [Vulcanimicrobiota bacterium]
MPTVSEVRNQITIALQNAGEAPMGARLDNLCFYYRAWGLTVLGHSPFEGNLRVTSTGVAFNESSTNVLPRNQIHFRDPDRVHQVTHGDSDRLLRAVLSEYAGLSAYALQDLVMAEPILAMAESAQGYLTPRIVNNDELARAFSRRTLPPALLKAGFTAGAWEPVAAASAPTKEERIELAARRMAEISPAHGVARFRAAVDVALVLLEFRLEGADWAFLAEWGAKCEPAIHTHEMRQCLRAAKASYNARLQGCPEAAEALKYRHLPGSEVAQNVSA